MTLDATPDDRQLALAPLDEKVDHVRGSPAGRLIIEYGDYECPYSRQAFYAIQQVERRLNGNMRFAFRHFPLTNIHPHALSAAAEAEALLDDGRSSPAGSHHLVYVQDFVHPARHSVGLPGSGILERVAVFIDAPHPGGDVADDFLGADDEDHLPRPRHERPQLAAAGGRDEQGSAFGQCVHAADDMVARLSQGAER